MLALIDKYSDEEFQQIVLNCSSFTELAKKLGYTANSGDLTNTIKQRIQKLNISTQHFKRKSPVKRTVQNVFVENSTAAQKTLRSWYFNGQYTDYICSICGQKPFWNGKELTLILDHINGSNHDNRIENLRWVCPNCNQQLDTTNGKNRKILKKKNYCMDCGKQISLEAIRCASCAAKKQVRKVENRPTREQLKNMIRTLSFLEIGRKYEVSDNTIRKWCDGYSLPRKKTDINNYSDLQWSKI